MTFVLDRIAVFTSVLCIVHCLATPLLLVVFPFLSTSLISDELFHLGLLFLVVPLSAVSLSIGCRRHYSWKVLTIGSLGVALLAFTAIFAHDLMQPWLETVSTIIGASLVATAHIKNFMLCRDNECNH